MTPFVWSAGHIGWPLFGILVFSALCLLATDIVWRTTRTSFRKLGACVALTWMIGITMALIAYFG